MNHVYSLVRSRVSGTLVAAPETARAHRGQRRLSLIASAVATAIVLLAAEQAAACGTTVSSNTTVSNAASGTCGLSNGAELTVTGAGSIDGGAAPAVLVDTGSVGGAVVNSGTLLGNVAGGATLRINGTLSGALTNQGLISNTSASGNRQAVLVEDGTVTGGIVNQAGGTITSSQGGIRLVRATVDSGVSNSGVIGSVGYAGLVLNTAVIQGNVFNDGTLNGEIFLDNSVISGAVVNAGLISAQFSGIKLSTGSTITGGVTNSGTISLSGTEGAAIAVDGGILNGGLTNTGVISASNGAYAVVANEGELNGGIHNQAGTISGATGIYVGGDTEFYGDSSSTLPSGPSAGTLTGGITNTGRIVGSTEAGVMLEGGTLTGGIHNQVGGTITGATNGVDLRHRDWALYVFDGSSSTTTAATATVYSTLSGGITNSGLIQGGNGSAIYAEQAVINGDIDNSGTLSGSNAGVELLDATTLAGSIVNRASGLIIGNGAPALYLSNSTVTGAILNQGTIAGGIYLDNTSLGNGTLSGGAIVNEATGIISGSTGIRVTSGASVVGGIVNSGRISGSQYALRLENSTGPITVDNAGTLEGNVDLGINTLNLNGSSARVIGNVATGGGTVNVNGTFSTEGTLMAPTINVASGGTLNAGHNLWASSGLANSGTVGLGVNASPIALTGNYSQTAGGLLRVDLADAVSGYGRLAVSGTASLANGTGVKVNIIGAPSLTSGAVLQGVLTAGTLSGSIASLSVTDNSPFYAFSASNERNANELDLVVEADRVGVVEAVRSQNNTSAIGAASALQAMYNDGVPEAMQPVFDKLSGLTSEQVSDAISQFVPSLSGAASQAGVSALHSMNKIIQARIESNHGLSSGDGARDQYAWVRAFGSWADQDDRKGVSGFESRTAGIVVGVDAPVNARVRAGGAFTYARSNIDGNSATAPNHVDVDTYELVGYASYNLDERTDINYQLDFGKNKAESRRRIDLTGSRAEADFDSWVVHASVGIGRVMPVSEATNYTPSIRLDYTQVKTDGYTEAGAGPLNLQVDGQTYREFLITGDIKGTHVFQGGLKLVGNASVSYDTVNKQAQTTSVFVGGGPSFVTDGLDVSPWIYRAGIGLIQDASSGVEYSARYDVEGRSSGYLNQTLSVRLRWAF